MPEFKVRLSSDTFFPWEAPQPVKDGVALDLLVALNSGSLTISLTKIHDQVAVTGTSSDRRTLTAPAVTALGARGAQGHYGKAWIVSDSDGAMPCLVTRVVDGEITLAEPLPRDIVGDGKIQWATWYANLSGSTVGAAEARNVEWSVDYPALYGLDLPNQEERSTGLLSVVRRPFQTGLTTEALLDIYPDLADSKARRAQGLEGPIRAAEDQMITRLRDLLLERGLYEDDLPGSSMRLSHAQLAAAIVLELSDPEQSAILREQAAAQMDEELRRVRIDEQDGAAEQGDEALTGSIPPAAGGSSTPSTSITSAWRSGADDKALW